MACFDLSSEAFTLSGVLAITTAGGKMAGCTERHGACCSATQDGREVLLTR